MEIEKIEKNRILGDPWGLRVEKKKKKNNRGGGD